MFTQSLSWMDSIAAYRTAVSTGGVTRQTVSNATGTTAEQTTVASFGATIARSQDEAGSYTGRSGRTSAFFSAAGLTGALATSSFSDSYSAGGVSSSRTEETGFTESVGLLFRSLRQTQYQSNGFGPVGSTGSVTNAFTSSTSYATATSARTRSFYTTQSGSTFVGGTPNTTSSSSSSSSTTASDVFTTQTTTTATTTSSSSGSTDRSTTTASGGNSLNTFSTFSTESTFTTTGSTGTTSTWGPSGPFGGEFSQITTLTSASISTFQSVSKTTFLDYTRPVLTSALSGTRTVYSTYGLYSSTTQSTGVPGAYSDTTTTSVFTTTATTRGTSAVGNYPIVQSWSYLGNVRAWSADSSLSSAVSLQTARTILPVSSLSEITETLFSRSESTTTSAVTWTVSTAQTTAAYTSTRSTTASSTATTTSDATVTLTQQAIRGFSLGSSLTGTTTAATTAGRSTTSTFAGQTTTTASVAAGAWPPASSGAVFLTATSRTTQQATATHATHSRVGVMDTSDGGVTVGTAAATTTIALLSTATVTSTSTATTFLTTRSTNQTLNISQTVQVNPAIPGVLALAPASVSIFEGRHGAGWRPQSDMTASTIGSVASQLAVDGLGLLDGAAFGGFGFSGPASQRTELWAQNFYSTGTLSRESAGSTFLGTFTADSARMTYRGQQGTSTFSGIGTFSTAGSQAPGVTTTAAAAFGGFAPQRDASISATIPAGFFRTFSATDTTTGGTQVRQDSSTTTAATGTGSAYRPIPAAYITAGSAILTQEKYWSQTA